MNSPRHAEHLEIHYDKRRWHLLKKLRSKAVTIMKILESANLPSITHGSVARGDVTVESDIDVFIPTQSSSFAVEMAFERARIRLGRRYLIQATPHYAVKAYMEINGEQTVSFPLVKMRQIERDFYRFSGEASRMALESGRRVAGVDKRLMLIEPTEKGHVERSVQGRLDEASKLLGISLEIMLDRVHALQRRDKIGRTGVFIERELEPDETFELALKRLVETRPEVRRRAEFAKK